MLQPPPWGQHPRGTPSTHLHAGRQGGRLVAGQGREAGMARGERLVMG